MSRAHESHLQPSHWSGAVLCTLQVCIAAFGGGKGAGGTNTSLYETQFVTGYYLLQRSRYVIFPVCYIAVSYREETLRNQVT